MNTAKRMIVVVVLFVAALVVGITGSIQQANASTRFPVLEPVNINVIYKITTGADWRKAVEQAIRQVTTAGARSDLRLTAMATNNIAYTAEYNCSKKNPCIILTGDHFGLGRSARFADDTVSGRPYKRHGYLNYSRGTEVGLTDFEHKRKTALGLLMVLLGKSNTYGTSHSVTNLGVFGQPNLATVDVAWLNKYYDRY